MKDQWRGSNVDLRLLSEGIEGFLVDNKFEAVLKQSGSDFRVEGSNAVFRVKVKVFGDPDDFRVEFIPSKKTSGFSSLSMIFGYIASAFGGGGLVILGAKVQEAVGVFEELFWDYVDKRVAELKDSGRLQVREGS